jgi:hypothetical protein
MPSKFTKDPDAVLDYEWDWSDWLGSDIIVSSDWVLPDGIVEDSSTHTDTTSTIWLSGGTVGESYEVVNRITTTAGRIDDRTCKFRIKEK